MGLYRIGAAFLSELTQEKKVLEYSLPLSQDQFTACTSRTGTITGSVLNPIKLGLDDTDRSESKLRGSGLTAMIGRSVR